MEQIPNTRLSPTRSFTRPAALLLLTLLAWLSVAAGPPVWRSNHVHPIQATGEQIQEMRAVALGPPTRSRAGMLQDRQSGAVLWQWNANQSLPMASVTKLMTVLVALETLSPDDVVTVPKAAIIGNASMGLEAGQKVHVRTLLYGALLPSGNDAAMTLAIRAAGSEQAFVEKMNQRAAEWGLTATHFANPHGLDAPDHYASARDLSQLALRALNNPLIAEIVATPAITIEGFNLTNTNQLLTTYPGAYGVKTGTTDNAGQVLIAAVKRPQGDALTVVMNSSDRFAETTGLMDFYFDHWVWLDVGLKQNVLNRVFGPDGVQYLLNTPPTPLFLQSWQASQLRPMRIVRFSDAGQPTGLFQVWLGEEKLVEVPLSFTPLPPLP